MTPSTVCRSLLMLVDSIPSTVPWGCVELVDDQHVFVHDARDEATSLVMEAIAGRFGEVVAVESLPSARRDHGPLLGCLIEVRKDADEVAGRLRAAYWTATEPSEDGTEGPF